MSSLSHRIHQLVRRYSPLARQRGSSIRRAGKQFELISFGAIHHEDDHAPILGFTASTTHIDQHYSVGTYDDYDIRLVDRFDSLTVSKNRHHDQTWLIVEVDLKSSDLPHIALVPTGKTAQEYSRFFHTHSHFQPLNATFFQNHSAELHGRFQILASTSRVHDIETILQSDVIAGIAARFWPHGIEIKNDKLYVYITEHRLTEKAVSATIASALWLAKTIDN